MKIFGDTFILEERLPPPSTIETRCITLESTHSGIVFGSESGVTPPIFIAVNLAVSSMLANETFLALSFFLIVLFMSPVILLLKHAMSRYFVLMVMI